MKAVLALYIYVHIPNIDICYISFLLVGLSIHEQIYIRRTPHPVIVTMRDKKDYIRVLLYSYYTTITGWGVLLRYTLNPKPFVGGHVPNLPGR